GQLRRGGRNIERQSHSEDYKKDTQPEENGAGDALHLCPPTTGVEIARFAAGYYPVKLAATPCKGGVIWPVSQGDRWVLLRTRSRFIVSRFIDLLVGRGAGFGRTYSAAQLARHGTPRGRRLRGIRRADRRGIGR